ncbi:PPE family protein [Mycobacterium persicum]|uniref:PPE family protein PPE32 n=1 Tax=Mycobacterium persicum TaxID=1487726 RepID=A0A1X0LAK0_9MYCO|nr:PPE family protein [Mycobacterium persicum]KZS81461.1 hypothetical protein A4G31_11500 [Mycobacterium persicum]ORB89826.1 hypothetical protein B1T49_12005 [Mycobacterium persicum]ORB95243.1 hypothetical protein B1T44_12850 [Mycobacterium persicum]ORC02002.1 hypothetical protein B1T48_12690 [Mycobacterium persicum]ORC07212.1 hypothetical protein B4U45_11915 [Mycobacterium persicum]
MDFGALPPEINSGLMYAGPGSASMLAAAAAWDGLAAELRSAATGYGSVIAELADAGWQGPSSAAMAAAAAPYVGWMHSTAVQAEQAGTQATVAAAAHEAAFAATVPPPVIAANRALLASLVATNFLGINTPAIMATEAHYAEMWAQDAAAMYAYAGAASAAAMLTPMAVAPATTNVAGLVGSAVAAGEVAVTNLQGAIQGLAGQAANTLATIPSSLRSSFQTGISQLVGLLGGTFGQAGQGAGMGAPGTGGLQQPAAPSPSPARPMHTPAPVPRPATPIPTAPMRVPEMPVLPPTRVPEMLAPGRTMVPLTAGMGQAGSVGSLSVPPSWAASAPEAAAAPAAAATPITGAGTAAPMMTRGIPAETVRFMQTREFGVAMPALAVLPRSVVG